MTPLVTRVTLPRCAAKQCRVSDLVAGLSCLVSGTSRLGPKYVLWLLRDYISPIDTDSLSRCPQLLLDGQFDSSVE